MGRIRNRVTKEKRKLREVMPLISRVKVFTWEEN